ncbi:uncharacterized protein F4822DRAFT_162687 [Hypoxylon trugodes]|uniref:uncharacterized protein n=1 Tax=Hypoxylon trugodes TaxID=326681 RepID=UPI00219C90FB|nr:uncharacterized protein F4822DRAFT_162687 [Hypoxylon trugodes]KAI1390751.1 hypothetical protein F4822DRAFT_162687 [Hypoxylon trugodes]
MSMTPGQYWDLLERNEPPIKRRANHAKVRTGCTTCKVRRVKCDEKKPCCSRCERSGYTCAGYEEPGPKRSSKSPTTSSTSRNSARLVDVARLRPKSLQPRVLDAMQQFPVGFLLPTSLTPAYLEGRDVPFFDQFRSRIMIDISTWCGADYWKCMLSEVMHDECIRHAALALSAMLQAVERCMDPPKASASSIAQCKEGQLALHHYMKAISLCRKQLIGGITNDTVRSNLTSTFFFAMIEILQGNMATVEQIMANGAMLIRDAIKAKTPSGLPAVTQDQQFTHIKEGFDKVTIMWKLSPFCHGQRDIFYTNLENSYRNVEAPTMDTPMPEVRRRWTMFNNELGLFMMSVRCGKIVPLEYMEVVSAQKSTFLAQLRQWIPVIDSMLEREKNRPEFYSLTIMKASALSGNIFLSCFQDRTDVSYDLHHQGFVEIIQLCQRFVPDKPPKHLSLTLDVDVFPVVSFALSKCRDQKTRQLALKIFREMTYRQVFWNNEGMLKSLQALIDLEQKGRDKRGFIPPSSRYYFVGSEWNFESRELMAMFVPVNSVPTEYGDLPTVRVPISF